MIDRVPPDLERWLNEAMAGLQQDVAAMTRDEIAAHYEDALDAYMDEGLPTAQAHTRAMTDLGASAATAGGLRDVHHGPQQYSRAALASFLVLMFIFVVPAIFEFSGGATSLAFTLTSIVQLALSVFALMVFKRLLRWRLDVNVERPIVLVNIGLAGEIIAAIVSELVFGSLDYAYMNSLPPRSTEPLALLLLGAVFISRAMAGYGALVIGRKVFSQGGELFGLARFIGLVALVMGVGLLGYVAAPFVGTTFMSYMFMVAVMIGHVFLWPLLTLLFFRAVYRSPVFPAKFA